MTTADVTLGFWEFGWWLFGLEEKGKKVALEATDWVYDRLRWLRREVARRKGYPTGSRRPGDERGFTVWEYLHRLPVEELEYEWKPRGQHRNNRGWRYPSVIPSLLERLREFRAWEAEKRAEIDRLMDDIHYMLDHPPQPASFTVHGCQDCLCGQIAALREEALA